MGSGSRIFGYEVDGLDFRMDDGLPFPTGADGADPAIEILALGLATNVEPENDIWGETLYVGNADAAFKAERMFANLTMRRWIAAVAAMGRSYTGNAVRERFLLQ
ncbi:hypothetical protein [uncultured Ruegeria sp.]|uniref:hypothetical protein n=1 Tax=uncultured Ruegeria sp. TaxID=259304 RepID=UPI002636EC05|nr:hypothetical protein [uncultured Ruegeria sp.]